MHRTGTQFVYMMLEKHGVAGRPISQLNVRVQVRRIDILIDLILENGNRYMIVIEDKVHAGDYNDLTGYLAAATQENGQVKVVCCLIGIFLRTGNQADFNAIEKQGFKIITRGDLINFLHHEATGSPTNTIYQNYKKYLTAYHNSLNAFRSEPVEEWDWNAWTGFTIYLTEKSELPFDGYKYIPNKQGGFQGCWQSNKARPSLKSYPVYIQIEYGQHLASLHKPEGLLAFKVAPLPECCQSELASKDRAREVFQKLNELALMRGFPFPNPQGKTVAQRNIGRKVCRPAAFQNGEYVTAAICPRKMWAPDGSSYQQVEAALAVMLQFLNEALSE